MFPTRSKRIGGGGPKVAGVGALPADPSYSGQIWVGPKHPTVGTLPSVVNGSRLTLSGNPLKQYVGSSGVWVEEPVSTAIWKANNVSESFSDLGVSIANWYGSTRYPGAACLVAKENSVIYSVSTSGILSAFGASVRAWFGLAYGGGFAWGSVLNGLIYRINADGSDVAITSINRNWRSICFAQDGNIYGCVYGGKIWRITPEGVETELSGVTVRNWRGICAANDGFLYAAYDSGMLIRINYAGTEQTTILSGPFTFPTVTCGPDGFLYLFIGNAAVQPVKATPFGTSSLLSIGNAVYSPPCVGFDGNIYAPVYGGSIWKRGTKWIMI